MRTLKISLLVFILPITLFSQEGWFFQNPLPQNNSLFDVEFVSPNIIYSVGAGGTIIKSTDMGESWEIQNSNIRNYLKSVFFLNPNRGWVVGDNGIILHTENGGATWIEQVSNVGNDLFEIVFINDSVGFICGMFKVLKTVNGGTNWYVIQELSNYNNLFYTINFASEDVGWLSGSGRKVVKTSNKGESWDLIYQGNNGSFNSLFFTDEMSGWGAGYGYIGKTTNGGYHWQYPAYWDGKDYKKILFINSSIGFALANRLYKTTDGGNTWIDYLNINFNANSISFNEVTGISVGVTGAIKKSTDSGTSWQTTSQNYLSYYVNDVTFVNNNLGWCISDTKVYHTSNGGVHWQEQPTPAYNVLHSICFTDESSGWISGYGKIIKTTNGGVDWEDSYILSSHHLYSIKFFDSSFGLAVGDSGKVLKSLNGGDSWSILVLDDSVSFQDIYFLTEDVIWLAGTKGLAFKSMDRGNTWVKYFVSENSVTLTGIVFKDTNNGWVSIFGGLLSTQNGGISWQLENFPIFYNYYAKIHLFNNKLWLIGAFGNILASDDDGLTWQQQNSNTISILRSIHFINEYIGWIAGDGYLILKTTNGGTTFVRETPNLILTNNFALSQNYPNPFNPTTSMQYTISSRQFVTLKVFDLLGREVATLVNEEKPAGEYEVEFNAANLPSGIYFYQLLVSALQSKDGKAGQYSETKKMILLK